MTIPIPLGVRLKTSQGTKHVTRELRDLTFQSIAPGGFASATLSIDRPLDVDPYEIGYYGKVYIDDLRNGKIVWEGRLEDLGRGASEDGEVWHLAAVGPSAHARDRTVPLVYVDSSMNLWDKASYSARGAEINTRERSEDDDANPAVLIQAPEGILTGTGWQGEARHRAVRDAGMKLARVSCNVVNGTTTVNLENRLTTATGAGSRTNATTPTFSTTEATLTGVINGGNNIPDGNDVVWLRIVRVGADATATSTVYGDFYDITVRACLKDATGADITTSGSYTVNRVLASEIVTDLLGRLLNKYDGPNASIAATSYDIRQLAYPDGTTAADVLDDLMVLEPAYYWAAWESNSAGLHRFEWKAWPTSIRYEADVVDGIDSPGSSDGLYNAVRVRWVDQRGRPRTTQRTQTVQALTDAGLTREAIIDLGDNIGSTTNATQAGDQFLAEHAAPPNSGSLNIARPIFDHQAGRSVMPWQILPGYLIRVRGILPNVNSLNATARDGVTIFKIASVTYSADSASAVLELDSYSYTVARALSQLNKRRSTRRR